MLQFVDTIRLCTAISVIAVAIAFNNVANNTGVREPWRSEQNVMIGDKICLFLAVYHSSGYLEEVLDPIVNLVDELVVADGPRHVSLPLLDATDMLYNETMSPIKAFLFNNFQPKYPGIHIEYIYRHWEKESDQRLYGYETCQSPIMLQIDSDMILNINKQSLTWFLEQPQYHIAQVDIVSLFHPSNPLYYTGSVTQYTVDRYPLMVKRHQMNAETYFNHLWIVGEDQKSVNNSIHSPVSIGFCYHLTLHMTTKAMLSKYAFYIGSWYSLYDPQGYRQLVESAYTAQKERGTSALQGMFLRLKSESSLGVKIEPGHRYTPLSTIDKVLFRRIEAIARRNIQFAGRVGCKDAMISLSMISGWNSWVDLSCLAQYKSSVNWLHVQSKSNRPISCSHANLNIVRDNQSISSTNLEIVQVQSSRVLLSGLPKDALDHERLTLFDEMNILALELICHAHETGSQSFEVHIHRHVTDLIDFHQLPSWVNVRSRMHEFQIKV